MTSTAGFQRARSEEQREARRRAILAAATAMLAEMPVAQLSLNELSRRVGLAKSNVLRYFESREAVLLELLDAALREWLDALAAALPAAADHTVAPDVRIEQVAAAIAGSAVARPTLCELISASAAVLEHNVSATVATRYKRAATADAAVLGELVRAYIPELTRPAANHFGAGTVLVLGAVWTHSSPSPGMQAAYEADPELAALRLDFGRTLHDVLATLLAGLLARPPR